MASEDAVAKQDFIEWKREVMPGLAKALSDSPPVTLLEVDTLLDFWQSLSAYDDAGGGAEG